MPAAKQRNAQTKINNKSQTELIFLAQDTVDNIRHAKDVSRYILSAYTAAFGFVWVSDCKEYPFLFLFFDFCCLLTIWFCACHISKKITERRQRLFDIYTKGFTKKYRDIYGNSALLKLRGDDGGDKFFGIFSSLYPTTLFVLLLLKNFYLPCTPCIHN